RQTDLGGYGDVAPERVAASERAAAAEEDVEQVADRTERVEVGGKAARAQAVVAVAVVGGSALGVGEDLVGLGGLLELLLGLRVVRVDVGVQLAREPAKRLLDVLLAGVATDAEHHVRVAGGRGAHRA